ncbi:MAG: NAD-dependent epimerase/dehydratase family protein [Thermoleophilia bacterium]
MSGTALVTGATGLAGRALVARLRADGVRVLATARSLDAEIAVREMGAEALHTDLANLGSWHREAADAEVVYHLALPRLDPPLRRGAAKRRAKGAGEGARALRDLAGDRPVVMLSSAFVYGPRRDPAADDDPAAGDIALAAAPRAAEEALAGPGLRVVRVPWLHGDAGLLRDLVTALRVRRFRFVGPADNPWAMISPADAAAALVAAAGAPPGVYSAAEEAIPTQREVVEAICAVPGHKLPDRAPAGMAALALGGAMAEALGAPLAVRTGRLADHGFTPRDDWRDDALRLAEAPLPRP